MFTNWHPFRVFRVFHSPCGTEQRNDCPLFGQEFFNLHPIKECFWTECFDFVDGGVDGGAQLDGTQVEKECKILYDDALPGIKVAVLIVEDISELVTKATCLTNDDLLVVM